MKANAAQIAKALKAPAETRFFLLHGPDEAGSRAMVKALAAAVGADAERIDLSGADLRADPARLADEAASISMFGGARWILVEQAGDEIVPALEALIEAPAAGNPVAIVAGPLKPASKLLKLALASSDALAHASYVPDGEHAWKLVPELARVQGLTVRADVAQRIFDSSGGNRAIAEQELAKFALYLDASPAAPATLDHDIIDALGAAADEGDLGRLADSAIGGDAAALESELARLHTMGMEGVTLIRALLRRMALLARLRAEVDSGRSPGAVMASSGKSIFFKEKDRIEAQLRRWPSDLLAKAIARLAEAERQVKSSGGVGPIAADVELFAVCRQAARLR
ncbi:MAG: DNA polymerase III subunit delta [Alphaproteobacteria bacterium]|nr:MAG: DNA polymerase III subunit delta [Alphaproteobacteria bacterium]